MKRARGLRPSPQALESRSLLSGYSPTAIEQLYLELLDDARFNPAAYGVSLGLDLSGVAPAQPLAMSPLLVESARLHSQDMIANNYFSHITPSGIGPQQRIQATGFPGTGWAESIETNERSTPASQPSPESYAAWDAGFSLADLIVDQGTNPPGHRIMLLDIGGAMHSMRQVGIGIASQDTSQGLLVERLTDTTIDTGSSASGSAFLTGVVFNDVAGNGEYAPGSGLSGVTITVAGAGSTATLDAGGYSMQLASGTYSVTASGGGLLAPITRTVVIGSDNVRLKFDLDPNGATFSATSGSAANVVLGSFKALQSGDTASIYSARIDWGDGHASFASLEPISDGGFTVNGSNIYATSGTYAVRVLVTRVSNGQSLAINSTAVVIAASQPGQGHGGATNSPPGASGTGSSNPGHAAGKKQKKHKQPEPHHHPKPAPRFHAPQHGHVKQKRKG